jgi:hypothetical protein
VDYPEYCKQFGSKNMSGLVHEGVPQEVFFALGFNGPVPHATVAFYEAFKAEGPDSKQGQLWELLLGPQFTCSTSIIAAMFSGLASAGTAWAGAAINPPRWPTFVINSSTSRRTSAVEP